ncbi:hypothetical protein BU15DRAFT_79667 [Melanogaster broomeanus]|nr:hypothetical protein BU15DRAFT_79667 [Melanogaster broomeanus]
MEEESMAMTINAITPEIKEAASKEIAAQVITAIAPHVPNMLQISESMKANMEGLEQIQASETLKPTLSTMEVTMERVEDAVDAVLSSIDDINHIIPSPSNRLYSEIDRRTSQLSRSNNRREPINAYSTIIQRSS